MLLNRFRSKLAMEGLDMGPVLEKFIAGYVQGTIDFSESGEIERATEDRVISDVLYVMSNGGHAAEAIRHRIFNLAEAIRSAAEDDTQEERTA